MAWQRDPRPFRRNWWCYCHSFRGGGRATAPSVRVFRATNQRRRSPAAIFGIPFQGPWFGYQSCIVFAFALHIFSAGERIEVRLMNTVSISLTVVLVGLNAFSLSPTSSRYYFYVSVVSLLVALALLVLLLVIRSGEMRPRATAPRQPARRRLKR